MAEWTPLMVRRSTKAELVELRLRERYTSLDAVVQSLLHPEKAADLKRVGEKPVKTAEPVPPQVIPDAGTSQ